MNEQLTAAHLKVQAGSNAIALRVGGIPGIPHGATVALSADNIKFAVTVPTELYPWLAECPPGSFVFVVFGLVRPFLEDSPEPDMPVKGLILPRDIQ